MFQIRWKQFAFWVFMSFLAFGISACSSACIRHSDCASDLVCVSGQCSVRATDAASENEEGETADASLSADASLPQDASSALDAAVPRDANHLSDVEIRDVSAAQDVGTMNATDSHVIDANVADATFEDMGIEDGHSDI